MNYSIFLTSDHCVPPRAIEECSLFVTSKSKYTETEGIDGKFPIRGLGLPEVAAALTLPQQGAVAFLCALPVQISACCHHCIRILDKRKEVQGKYLSWLNLDFWYEISC